MVFPALTAFYAAILALIYVALAGWVIGGRLTHDTLFGEGDDGMMRRVRSHANFAEYVPLALLLIGFFEAGGGNHGVVRALLIVLIVARLLHPIGMLAAKNTPQQFACRGGGIMLTLGVMVVTAIALIF